MATHSKKSKSKSKKSSKSAPKAKKTSSTAHSSPSPPPPNSVDPTDAWINKDADPNQRSEFRRIVDDLRRLRDRKDGDQFTLWEAALSAERDPSVQFCLVGQNFDKFIWDLIGIPAGPYRSFTVALQYIAITQLKFIGPTGAVAIGRVLRGLSNDSARSNMASHVFPMIFERFNKHVETHGAPPANGSTFVYDIARQHGLWTKKGQSFKKQSAQAITTVRNMVLKNREALTRIKNGAQCSPEVQQMMEVTDRIGTRFLTCLDEIIVDDESDIADEPMAAAG